MKKKTFVFAMVLSMLAGCASSESALNAARTAYLKVLSVERGLMIAAAGAVEAGVMSREKGQAVLVTADAALILQGTAYIVAGGRHDEEVDAGIDATNAARITLYQAITNNAGDCHGAPEVEG